MFGLPLQTPRCRLRSLDDVRPIRFSPYPLPQPADGGARRRFRSRLRANRADVARAFPRDCCLRTIYAPSPSIPSDEASFVARNSSERISKNRIIDDVRTNIDVGAIFIISFLQRVLSRKIRSSICDIRGRLD